MEKCIHIVATMTNEIETTAFKTAQSARHTNRTAPAARVIKDVVRTKGEGVGPKADSGEVAWICETVYG